MKRLILVIIAISISIPIQAKWASFEDAPVKSSHQQEISVNNNGTSEAIITIQFEILKEPGRSMAANYNLQYNGDCQKVKILEAKTVYKNKEYNLDKNLIEDKPLASPPNGFDQIRQILLAFPKAEIGAKIYLKYSLITTEVPLNKFYATVFDFGNQEYVVKSHVKLHSKIPLYILINDPEKVLKITSDKDKNNNFYNMEITLIKPLFKSAINEPALNIINSKYLTWVSVSSLNKWEDLAAKFGQFYTQVFTQALPKDFIAIANTVAQKKNEVEQINTVTSLLNNKIQYMGDWRTIKGKFIPRSLAVISETQLGDCKDFAASTAAILTKLGYKAQVASVRRGVGNFYPESLPDLGAFNHDFVKITNKEGKVYWIDPTNFQSMADGIFPDIAGKMALILDPKNPSYEKVQNINSEHAQTIFKRQIKIADNNKIIESGDITLKNEKAYIFAGATLQSSEAAIKDVLFNFLSDSRLEEKNKKYLHLPDLNSRIVKNVLFDYAFERENGVLKTNLGQALKLAYPTLASFFDVSQDFVTDIVIDSPFTLTRNTVIKNIDIQNIDLLNKEIKTPWLQVMRKCELDSNHDLQIRDSIIVYKNLIPNKDLKTPEFKALKNGLEKDFKDVAVVFTKRN